MIERGKGSAEPERVRKQRATTGRSTGRVGQRPGRCAERQSVDCRVAGGSGRWARPIRCEDFRRGCEKRGGDGEQLDESPVAS